MNSDFAIEVQASPEQRLGMPVQTFLRDYWQKRPLLIRQAFPDFERPLEPDDLGGLGCEETALSRLIEYDREHDRWTVHTGPLDESLFARLPDRDWTLLVQDVDKWDADVSALLEHFRFLPSWRIDDVMISYAEDGGGVGAHVDQYDVFLLQGMGKRRWSIDAKPHPPTAFREGLELKLLREFSPSHTWTLETGDMLYLPPGVPHDGVADGQCMTFSIGMRAPSKAELLLDFSEYLAEKIPETERLSDAELTVTQRTGEIDSAALARVKTALGSIATSISEDALIDWFGPFITQYRCAQMAAPPDQTIDAPHLLQALATGNQLVRHPWARLAWADTSTETMLFAAGEALPCPQKLAERLCTQRPLDFETAPTSAEATVLVELLNRGHLVMHEAML